MASTPLAGVLITSCAPAHTRQAGSRHSRCLPSRTSPARSRQRAAGRAGVRTQAAGGDELRRGGNYNPYPFNADNYYKVALQLVQGNMSGMVQGFLLLMREDEKGMIEDSHKGLVVAVGGDALAGIAMLAQGKREGERPLALDLLWQVLTRGREISSRDWSLLRVAIVGMRGNTYLGRVWFGTQDKVMWDCDARPSDSIWLSLKSSCPLYVHREVWEAHATPLEELQSTEEQEHAMAQQLGGQQQQQQGDEDPMAIRPSDPEVIKRMKSELRVLILDENYEQAARLRDHPVMSLYLERTRALSSGDRERARRLDQKLQAAIDKFESGEAIE